jgi:biopolymer transport protein ExbB
MEEPVSAEIDWLVEMSRGGNTGIVLFALGFLMITLAVERLFHLRSSRLVPPEFVQGALPLWEEDPEALRRFCEAHPSSLARMTLFLADHRHAAPDLLIQGAADIGNRELLEEQKKGYGLAVIAGLAPLLGLLGTIIGMIESFKLVEIYGDDGGATILAGSISKALITTALGLIIAIPSLGLYHLFRMRVQSIGQRMDESMERLISAWLLKPSSFPEA